MMKLPPIAGRAALLLFFAALARASVPQALNYQGAYREGGIPVSGMRTMTFRLTSADGSVEHWTSGPTSVSVSTGVFRATLSLPASLDWGAITPYIEVSVGTTTLLPRDPLRSSIYAVHAATAELVAPGAITDASVAAGAAISLSKLSSAGSLGLGTASPAGPLHVRTVGQDALFVSPVNAYVGLGTVTPAERLEVKNGSIKLTGIGASIVFADNTVMNSANLGSANAVTNAIDLLLQGDSDANGNGDILLKTGVSERLRVANNGFVGVGTAVPASKLHLALPSSRDLAFSANAGGAWLVGLPSGGNTSLVNDQAVNVHAGGDGAAVGGVANNPHTGLGAALTLYGNDNVGAGSAVLSASGGAGTLILKTASSERARLTSSGDLGLGTASPSARLHVSGGGLQVGDASASTFSASGYLTLANLGSAPAGAPGRLYYDSASSKLRLSNGAGFVDIATFSASGGFSVSYGVAAGSATLTAGLTASSGTFTASGPGQYSLSLSSGINAPAGTINAGLFVGNGAGLTGVSASNIAAVNVTAGTLIPGVLLNAGSLTNGPVASSILPSTVAYTSAANTFTAAQSLPTVSSTMTIQGNAFSVGGSTLVVKDGNVGISTATPTERLMVLGNAKVGDATSAGTVYYQLLGHHDNAGGSGFRMQFDRTSDIFGIAREFSGFQPPSLVIKRADGNVGIGTTSPGAKLDVAGHQLFSMAGASITFNAGGPTIGVPTANTLAFGTAGIERARIDNVGNVGIGTASPSSKLHVQDGDIQISTTSGVHGVIFQDGTIQTTALGGSSATTTVDIHAYGTLQNAVAQIGSQAKRLRVTSAQTVSSNLTIPQNIVLDVDPGAVITVSNSVILTVAGPINAGLYQIFSGAGAVHLRFQTVDYPEWWGAKANGVDDDYAAVQAAINAYNSPPTPPMTGVVKLHGNYAVSQTLTITTQNTGIEGDWSPWYGGNASVITFTTLNTNALYIHSNSQMAGNFVRNLSIVIVNDSGTSGAGINVNNATRTNITDVKIVGFPTGISFTDVIGAQVTRVRTDMLYNANGSVYGIYLDGTSFCASNTIRDTFSTFPAVHSGNATGIYWSGVNINDLFLENNEITGADTGIYINATGPVRYDVKIDKPVIDAYRRTAIELEGFGGDGGATVMNGWIAAAPSGGTVSGVKTTNASGIKVVGVEFVGNANATLSSQYGILSTNCLNCIISNNTFRNYYNAIGASGMATTAITGNSFLNTSSPGAAAVYVTLSGASNRNTITANTFDGYANQGVLITNGSLSNTVTANTFNPTNIATLINNSSDASNLISNNGTTTDISYLPSAGGTMTGPLTLSGSTLTVTGNAFSVGGSTLVVKDGNVGISTATPTERLMVLGNAKVGDATSAGTVYYQLLGHHDNAGGSGFRMQFDRTNDIFGISREFSGFQPPSLVIQRSDGNVGIGTTNPGQALEVSGGARLNTAAPQPACNAASRGTFWVVQSGAGVKDNVQVCAKDAADAYAWRAIY